MEWWKRFIELREEKGKLQKDIAKYLGIANNTYSQYETGKREPSIDKLKLLAMYYGCSLDYLVGATDDRSSETSDLTIASIFKKIKVEELADLIKKAKEYEDED